MRKFGGEMILFLCSLVLSVLTAVAFLKRDDGAFRNLTEKNESQAQDLVSVKAELSKVQQEFRAMADITSSELFDLQKRLASIEHKPEPSPDINLSFKEPLKVSVVYREAKKKPKPLLPEVPKELKKTPPTKKAETMLDRAGFIREETGK